MEITTYQVQQLGRVWTRTKSKGHALKIARQRAANYKDLGTVSVLEVTTARHGSIEKTTCNLIAEI